MKISDLGMSRKAENYYSAQTSQIPIRWSAPEVLEYRKYSHKSDVWSFGVLMWEIFTEGKIPYKELDNNEVVAEVLSGYRLEKPPTCPDNVFEIMMNCWAKKASERPTFEVIFDQISTIIEP